MVLVLFCGHDGFNIFSYLLVIGFYLCYFVLDVGANMLQILSLVLKGILCNLAQGGNSTQLFDFFFFALSEKEEILS